ncbi:hypothetical protein ACYSUO_31665 [Streptomyces sp. UC4497]
MRKGILRAVVAGAFSAGLVLGAIGPMDAIWNTAPAAQADAIWNVAPTTVQALPGDAIWNSAPTDAGA